MGKCKENPRYNVISCRVSDAELQAIESEVGPERLSGFLLEAALEKVLRERQRRMDHALSQ